MPGGAAQSRKKFDGWQDWAKQRGARGLAYVLVGEDGELGAPSPKNLSDAEREGLAAHVGAAPGDGVFFAAGERPSGARAARRGPARDRPALGLIDEKAWSFALGRRRPAVRAVGGRAGGR